MQTSNFTVSEIADDEPSAGMPPEKPGQNSRKKRVRSWYVGLIVVIIGLFYCAATITNYMKLNAEGMPQLIAFSKHTSINLTNYTKAVYSSQDFFIESNIKIRPYMCRLLKLLHDMRLDVSQLR